MPNHGRTARILTAIEAGFDTPPSIGKELGLPTAKVRDTLFTLRRTGQATRTGDGTWQTLPSPNPQQIHDILTTIETHKRKWSIDELATCTDLTTGQIIAITDTLARAGLIERVGQGSFRHFDPHALDRY